MGQPNRFAQTNNQFEAKSENWIRLKEEFDMSKSSDNACKLLKRLHGDMKHSKTYIKVTVDQIRMASQIRCSLDSKPY